VDWSQDIYLFLLLVGSIAAYRHGSKFIILVMWCNFLATMLLSSEPLMVALVDIASAWAILMVVQNRAAFTIAGLFCVMALIYPASIIIGASATYTIVDVLAYVQIFAMGSTGFGSAIRFGRDRYRKLFDAPVSIQKDGMEPNQGHKVALGKDLGN